MIPPRIYADFNGIAPKGFVRFDTAGSLRDIAMLELTMTPGMLLRVTDGDLRATVVVHGPGGDGVWSGEIIDGPHERFPELPFALFAFADSYGPTSGLATSLIWHPSPCYFEVIATDHRGSERLFAASHIERRTYKRLERALRRSKLLEPARKAEIAAARKNLVLPNAMLAFTDQVLGPPTRWRKVGDLGDDVASVLERGKPDAMSRWRGIHASPWRL